MYVNDIVEHFPEFLIVGICQLNLDKLEQDKADKVQKAFTDELLFTNETVHPLRGLVAPGQHEAVGTRIDRDQGTPILRITVGMLCVATVLSSVGATTMHDAIDGQDAIATILDALRLSRVGIDLVFPAVYGHADVGLTMGRTVSFSLV